MKKFLISLAALWFAGGAIAAGENSKIVWDGQPCEIALGEVSARTVQLVIAPLDAQGKPTAIPEAAAFLKLPIVEKFRARELAVTKEIAVGKMRITITAEPLTISVHRADGGLVQELKLDGDQKRNLSFETKAPVFGLGQGDQQFDRRGNFYEMIRGQKMKLRTTYGSSQPIPFLIGADGWSIFVRSPGGQFDLRGDKGLFLPAPKTTEPLTIYISEWDEPVDALTEYYHLTGKPAMPPKWTMGYMQSHRTLLGPDDALNIAKTFRDKKLPVDAVIYLGTGYTPSGWNRGHGSIEYNPLTFPHPVEQINALHDLNLKVVLHVTHAPKNLFGLSISEKSDSPDFIGNYWKQHLPRMAEGVDAWWPDDGDELPIAACLARHTCYYEGCLQERPNERPWSLHRNASAGVARYGGWIWSGDVNSDWVTLKNHVPVGLNSSVSMTPFWGTDIGGFLQTPEMSGELYARWFQFGAFNPLFRSHGRSSHLHLPWGWDTGEAGPDEKITFKIDPAELHNAQVEPICRQYLELRYRLLPYNYTLMRESVDTGMPAMRALWLHYPKDAEAVKLGDEYLWGRDLLIAPVVEKGATNRHLYLPAGGWYDWWTGEKIAGGKWLDRPLDLATMPIYVRAGAILPLDPVRQYTAQPVTEPTTIRVYPEADGAFTLYDDDGKSLNDLKESDPKATWIRFQWDDQARQLTLEADPRMKKWRGEARRFKVEIADDEGKSKTMLFYDQRLYLLEQHARHDGVLHIKRTHWEPLYRCGKTGHQCHYAAFTGCRVGVYGC